MVQIIVQHAKYQVHEALRNVLPDLTALSLLLLFSWCIEKRSCIVEEEVFQIVHDFRYAIELFEDYLELRLSPESVLEH